MIDPLPEFLEMPAADMICLDFSDNVWHIGFAGAVELANRFPEAKLLTVHWGCVDAPGYTPFDGDPERLALAVRNPDRVHALALGEGLDTKGATPFVSAPYVGDATVMPRRCSR